MGMFISNLTINEELQIMYCTFNGFECVYNAGMESLTMKGSIGGTREEWYSLHQQFKGLYQSHMKQVA